MRIWLRSIAVTTTLVLASLAAAGCGGPEPPPDSWFDEHVEPILKVGCVQQTTGCHLVDPEGRAAGNLDLTSYDSLMRRRDLLPAYGPYPYGGLLLKGGQPASISVETLDPPDPSHPDQRSVTVTTDIRHAAGPGIQLGSRAFATLRQWIDEGYSRNGMPVLRDTTNRGECVSGAGRAAGFDAAAAPADRASYDRFVRDVQPMLRARCAGSSCHGASLADLHLACGDTQAELRWNFFIAVQHLADPVERSELLLRPLAVARGGAFHGGGDTFATKDDAGYRTLSGWATDLVTRRPDLVREDDVSDGYRFFVDRVQPTLVRKGCMLLGCHSPISPKLNLRGGSQGSFSRFALRINYRIARKMLALESPDPDQSRLIAKNLFPSSEMPGGRGILHRGGSLLEDFGSGHSATLADCEGVDADHGDLDTVPAYCVLARWQGIERQAAIARGEVLGDDQPVRAVVWVARPLGTGDVLDFETYRPGADLRMADATVAPDGSLSLSAPYSILSGCGLDPTTADVRQPAASWDGTRIAFAARSASHTPYRLYWMAADGSGCEPIPGVAPSETEQNGILLEDFDPAFAPDGRIVFASTRGNLDPDGYGYRGPTRTPAGMAPNANLYVFDPSGAEPLRQLTFLLDEEVEPGFMNDGRVIYTAEKRGLGFHQIALRRQNLDGGDYHPLYAQRPTLGFSSASEVAQLPNQDFVFVASDLGDADGAGTIATFNRSIGPDQSDRDPNDRAFLHSMQVPDPGAMGGLRGVFRSPAPLPTGRLVVSCDLTATDPTAGPFDYDLCELDPTTGTVRPLLGEAGVAEVEAVAVYARTNQGVLRSDGGGIDRPDIVAGARDAVVRFNDFPMIASLMFDNTRTGRPVDPRIGGFDVIEQLPPPPGAVTFDDVADQVVDDAFGPFFLDERLLGHVPTFGDGSAKYRLPGGTPIRYRLTDADGHPLTFEQGMPFDGLMEQRECEQYYPGERIERSIPRRFFDAVCGSCHGSLTGRELDVAVDIDVVSQASINAARDADPVDLVAP